MNKMKKYPQIPMNRTMTKYYFFFLQFHRLKEITYNPIKDCKCIIINK